MFETKTSVIIKSIALCRNAWMITHCMFHFCFHMYLHNTYVSPHKRLLKFVNLYKVLVFWQFRCQYFYENTVFAPNPWSNLKIKYWIFQSMWNLKNDFGTKFWDILTLHPHISKSSLPTTGTFRYVESHIVWYLIWFS